MEQSITFAPHTHKKLSMKKNFVMFFAVALTGLALTACGNEDPAKPLTYNEFQTATITGKVLVNTDYASPSADQKWSAAPAEITIIAEVSNAEITGSPAQGTYRTEASYNATTAEYTVEVPVSNMGSQVKITVKDWTGTVMTSEYDVNTANNIVKQHNVLWHSAATTVSGLLPGDVSINNNIRFEGEGYYAGSYTKLNEGVGTPVN